MHARAANGYGDTGREVAISDQPNARTCIPDVCDQFLVPRAVENNHLPVQPLRNRVAPSYELRQPQPLELVRVRVELRCQESVARALWARDYSNISVATAPTLSISMPVPSSTSYVSRLKGGPSGRYKWARWNLPSTCAVMFSTG